MCRLLLALKLRGREPLFGTLTYVEYRMALQTAPDELGLRELEPTPHSPRHSGPSNDILHGRMQLMDAQKRGRWVSASSVQRYEKHARVLRQMERLSPVQRRRAAASHATLPAVLLQAFSSVKTC